MKNNICITLMLLSFLGCSDKEPTPKVSLNEAVDVNKSESNTTVLKEFIPEHLKHSKIEVVKHY